jgi:hypothetical protein
MSWSNWTISNHKRYIKKHGYGGYIENGKSDPRDGGWSKFVQLLRHFQDDKHEWYWSIGIDALIMNCSMKPDDMLLDDDYDLVLNRDLNMFDSSSFFIRNSEWSRKYLQEVLAVAVPEPVIYKENAAMMVICI